MRNKLPSAFLLFAISLSLLFLVSCGPIVIVIVTPTPLPVTPSPTLVPVTETPFCPPENWPCPNDSLTLTAVMGATLDAIPTNTPPAGATIIPMPGDLGWGSIHGRIIDGITMRPLVGATVKCEHFSYTSPYRCSGTVTTDTNGFYSFDSIFFHDTDRITLLVEAPGYEPLHFEQSFFTRPDFPANLGLFPLTPTPTPFLMCTPPPCSGGDLTCGKPDGCPGGCGTICVTATPTPY